MTPSIRRLEPAPDPLPPGVAVSELSLVVRDLERSAAFYTGAIGLETTREEPDERHLGAGGATFLRLVADPSAPVVPGATGLFHLAILFPTRSDLAVALRRLADRGVPLQGASDHGVSEALYLADPEGNGIELYRDRPRGEWPARDGVVAMGTLPLDVRNLLAEAPEGAGGDVASAGVPAGTRLGHIHLRVNDVPAAEAFYRDVIGLDLMQRYGSSASFLSAGGYHHHVGVNSWGTAGAAAPPPGAAGLSWFRIDLHDADARERIRSRLEDAGHAVAVKEGALHTFDPSGNRVVI